MAQSPVTITIAAGADPVQTFFAENLAIAESAKFYEFVGRFLALWSRIELAINQLVNPLHQPDSLPDEFKRYPISLDRKLMLLDYYFGRYEDFAPFRGRYAEVRNSIKALSEDRHNLTHMMYSGFTTYKGETSLFLQTFHKQKLHKKRYYSLKKIEKLLTRAGYTAMLFLLLVSEVQQALLARRRV